MRPVSESPHQGKVVCFVLDRLIDRSGGAERIVVELANYLGSTGRQVHLVTYERYLGKPFYPLGPNVIHLNLRAPAVLRSYPRRAFDRARDLLHLKLPYPEAFQTAVWWSRRGGFVRAFERYAALHRLDRVIAVAPPAIVVVAHAELKYPVRKIASLHNVPELDLESPLRWDRNPLDIKRRISSLRHFDGVTVLQPSFRDWFDEELKQKVFVVPNPVYPARETPFSSREKKIIYVGRIALPKRVHLLAQSWGRIHTKFPDWKVEVFGSGPYEDDLAKLIRRLDIGESFVLKGETREIEQAYQSASVLAHPAEYEGWGLAVSEALSHGIPAVGYADCPGVNELIQHEKNGLLVAGQDLTVALAGGLERLLSNENLRRTLGEAAAPSMARFSPQRVRQIWTEVIDG